MVEITLNDAQFALCDRIEEAMRAKPDRDWSPSEIARAPGVKATVAEVHGVLGYLVGHKYLVHDDRGARSRYSLRQQTLFPRED
jgi:hypothetical protein